MKVQFTRIEAIINSMTKQERDKHEIISGPPRTDRARLGDDGAGSESVAASICSDG